MGKILNFPTDWVKNGNPDKFMSILLNQAICDSTDEILIDHEDIEERLENLAKNDSLENRIKVICGLCFFDMAIVLGGEDWKEYTMQEEDSYGYVVFTHINKIPQKQYKKIGFEEFSFRRIIEELADEKGSVEIYVNPGSSASFIFNLQVIRATLEIIDKAVEFADEQMKKGYSGEELTDVMFERFEFRNVEITLKDNQKLVGEVTSLSYGDDPNANYEITAGEKKVTIYRKDIAFIKDLGEL